MLKIEKKERKVKKRVTLARLRLKLDGWQEKAMFSALLSRGTWKQRGKDMLKYTVPETTSGQDIRRVNVLLWSPEDRDMEAWNKASKRGIDVEFSLLGAVIQKVTTASGFEEIDILLYLPDTSREPSAVSEIDDIQDLLLVTFSDLIRKIAGVIGACQPGTEDFIQSLHPPKEEEVVIEEIEVKDEDLLDNATLEQTKNSAE